jgi:hypothetical protein
MKQNIEVLQALYASPEMGESAMLLAGQRIFRTNFAGRRYYSDESGHTYASLTTLLSAVVNQKFLNTWREEMAAEYGNAELVTQHVQATADYGTALHIAVADFVRNGKVNWSDVEDFFYFYLLDTIKVKPETVISATNELIKDLACIVQFFHEYKVVPLAVELPVFKKIGSGGLATCIDLVVNMEVKKQTHRAAINLKSGKKGFYESHGLQLAGEMMLYNETYGALTGNIEHFYNLAPKNFRKTPTYTLHSWDKEKETLIKKFETYLQLATLYGVTAPPVNNRIMLYGETKFGESPDSNIMQADLEFILEQFKKNNNENQEKKI